MSATPQATGDLDNAHLCTRNAIDLHDDVRRRLEKSIVEVQVMIAEDGASHSKSKVARLLRRMLDDMRCMYWSLEETKQELEAMRGTKAVGAANLRPTGDAAHG